MVWYGMARGLMTAPQLGRGRHQLAGGVEAGMAEAEVARAGAVGAGAVPEAPEVPGAEAAGAARAEVMAAVGASGVAGQEQGSVATSDRQQPRGLA